VISQKKQIESQKKEIEESISLLPSHEDINALTSPIIINHFEDIIISAIGILTTL